MDEKNVFEWLWLVNCLGCGNKRIWDIMQGFSGVSDAYMAMINSDSRNDLLTSAENKAAAKVSEKQINELISYCTKNNIYILTYDDEKYPDRLRSIFNPPAVLFCRGDMTCLENDFSLSVVGTRKPSVYSVKVTESLVKELVGFGITIVSGFAVGIDIAANMSAVRNGGKTIAVLGCGLDYNYPRENSVYREDIEKNGLFISEYFPQATGTLQTFPARNRILAALSLGTIVVEAGMKSGALVSAGLALSQGRDVFAVAPHNLFDKRYGGNVSLIRDGAVCLCGVNDILYEYYENYGHKIANTARNMNVDIPPEISGRNEEKNIKKLREQEFIGEKNISGKKYTEFDPSGLEGEAAKIYAFLKEGGKPMLADDLAAEFDMDISEMLMLLTDLEIDGAVSPEAGQTYRAN